VARVLEHGARVVGDAGKLWLGLDGLSDLLQEANHWAGDAGHSVVEAADVQRAMMRASIVRWPRNASRKLRGDDRVIETARSSGR
jgi:predicted ATP-dependent protease